MTQAEEDLAQMQEVVDFMNTNLVTALERIQELENHEITNRDQEIDHLNKYIATMEENNEDLLKSQNEQKCMYDQDKKEKQCLIDKLQIDNQVQQE